MKTRASRLAPPLLDVVLAAALVVAAELEAVLEPVSVPRWVDGLVVLGFTVPLAWRRRAPLTVLAIATATVLVYGEVESEGSHQTLILALALASFTAGYELARPRAWAAPAMILAADAFAMLALGQDGGDFVFVLVIYVGPWVFGQALRTRGHHVEELSARAERLERERERAEVEAVEAERARIARELHDVVSHSISVITVQAQAIRRRLGPEHEREAADLAGVETTARQAMAEMRRLLGMLRSDGERLPLAPHPGLDQLPRLVEQVRASGLAVDVSVERRSAAAAAGRRPRGLPDRAGGADQRAQARRQRPRHRGRGATRTARIALDDRRRRRGGAAPTATAATACWGCASASRSTAGSWRSARRTPAAGSASMPSSRVQRSDLA